MNDDASDKSGSNLVAIKQQDKDQCKGHSPEKSSPFNLQHIFGFNPAVPLLNLSNHVNPKLFAVVSAHVIHIHCCDDNSSKCFIGHENEIIFIDTDSTGRFLVSVDTSSVVNVWDRTIENNFPHPIRTIYEPYNNRKLAKLAFSNDGKYILMASDGNGSLLKFWQWSYGEENPNDIYELPQKYGNVKSIKFSPNKNDRKSFVVTTENGIIFGNWEHKVEALEIHYPARAISIVLKFIDTIFVENSHKAISITECGSAVVWSDIVIEQPNVCFESSFKKEFIKCIKLRDHPLCVVKSVDNTIVIADITGEIRFYDKELKIIFWCPNYDLNSIITISFNLTQRDTSATTKDITSGLHNSQSFLIRDFFVATKSELYFVDFLAMKFEKVFYKCDDYITAFDVFPLNEKLICCGNYSGRIFFYDFQLKKLTVDNQINLQRRKSSTSDTEVIEVAHISCLTFSINGRHLFCGLENGNIIQLEPNILTVQSTFKHSHVKIISIKFSKDSTFLVFYDEQSTIGLFHYSLQEWNFLGKSRSHFHPICDVLYITSNLSHQKLVPRLISLGQDRQIVEYDLFESMKDDKGLVVAFSKRIFQSAVPVAMTLIYSVKKHEEHLLISDTDMKFKLFDKNTFEILYTFLGPLYDSYVMQFDANTSVGLTVYSKFFIFSTNKNICLYAMPVDGNPFRSLGIVGHCSGIISMKTDSTRQVLFTIGNNCQSIFMWNINFRPLFDHLDECGTGLKPYCNLIPGGKYGSFFQEMQNLFYYMQIMANVSSIEDIKMKDCLEVNEIPDYMRGLGYFPTDYEIQCMNNELLIDNKRSVSFEDLVKLYLNYSSVNGIEIKNIESAMKNLIECNMEVSSNEIDVTKSQIVAILTESAEKVDEKEAELYLRELWNVKQMSFSDTITLSIFLEKFLAVNP